MSTIIQDIQEELNKENDQGIKNKISYDFIKKLALASKEIYLHPTPNTRICILVLESEHEVIGYARVLDSKNDDEEIGNSVAYDNAVNEIWSLVGSIAKALM